MFGSEMTTVTRTVKSSLLNGKEVLLRQQYEWVSEVGGEVSPVGKPFIRLSDGYGNVWHLLDANENPTDETMGIFYDFDAGRGESTPLALGEYIKNRLAMNRRIYNT